jgi:hypothetical protein
MFEDNSFMCGTATQDEMDTVRTVVESAYAEYFEYWYIKDWFLQMSEWLDEEF